MTARPAIEFGDRAPSGARLPDLRIVRSDALLLHEENDPHRVPRLAQTLTEDGVVRNPPVVAALDSGEYVVLDGANRVTALIQIGCPDQVVQVVDYDDPAIQLGVWAHLLLSDPAPATAGWQALSVDEMHAGLERGRLACAIVTDAGVRGLPVPVGIVSEVATIANVVSEYKERAAIHRVVPADFEALRRHYGLIHGLVLFPRLTKDDVRAVARLPVKLPSGITRHIVENRALRVNVDLAMLREHAPPGTKQARLDAMIAARLNAGRVRQYAESTVLFDE
jgi:hypothetical protein